MDQRDGPRGTGLVDFVTPADQELRDREDQAVQNTEPHEPQPRREQHSHGHAANDDEECQRPPL